MPWTPKGSYAEHKNKELKQMLMGRGLVRSGTKAEMCARLVANDIAHPFPFLKLPPEIRNTIYVLVATSLLTSEDPRVKTVVKKQGKIWSNDQLHGSPELMIIQPGLFAVCRQLRREGLILYYQHHKFACRLLAFQPWRLKHHPLLKWLNTIGNVGLTNIRYLRFRVADDWILRTIMEDIHQFLSDDATVIWEPEVDGTGMGLCNILSEYRRANLDKLPVFETDGHQMFSTFKLIPASESRFRQTSLIFQTHMGWFGEEDYFGEEETEEDTESEGEDGPGILIPW